MTDIEFSLQTSEEITQELAIRAKDMRTHLNISQEDFAKKAGLNYHTYASFERSGKISLERFINVVRYLGRIEEINKLLVLDDVERIGLKEYSKVISKSKRKRASKKSI